MRENGEIRVRIPQVKDIRLAVELYYSRLDLSAADISALFGGISRSTVTKLKALAERQREEDGVSRWSASRVNTLCAYKAWGLDIEDLEKRVKALDRMSRRKLTGEAVACGV